MVVCESIDSGKDSLRGFLFMQIMGRLVVGHLLIWTNMVVDSVKVTGHCSAQFKPGYHLSTICGLRVESQKN